MKARHECQARVSSGFFSHACGKNAAYEHEGKHFCKTHHPPTVKEKDDARHAAWKAKWKAKWEAEKAERMRVIAAAAEQKRRADLYPELLEVLQEAINCPMRTEGDAWWTRVRIVLAKATGGQP